MEGRFCRDGLFAAFGEEHKIKQKNNGRKRKEKKKKREMVQGYDNVFLTI